MPQANQEWDLIKKAQEGDKAAFEALVIKHQNKLLKSIKRYLHNSNEAKDIVQETLIKAYNALANFRGDSNFYTWLYQIGINTAKNYLIQKRHQLPIASLSIDLVEIIPNSLNLQKNVDTPESYLEEDETKKLLLDTLDSLPSELQRAFILREIKGLSYSEIAETMHCPIGTVRSRLFRARKLIDVKLQRRNKK